MLKIATLQSVSSFFFNSFVSCHVCELCACRSFLRWFNVPDSFVLIVTRMNNATVFFKELFFWLFWSDWCFCCKDPPIVGSTVLPPVFLRSRPGEILTRNELAPRPWVSLGMFNLDHGFYGSHGFLAYITCSYMDINAIHRILECYQQRNQLNKHSWTIDWIWLSPLVLDVYL